MIPEIGHFALILALLFSACLAIVPLIGYWKRNQLLMATAQPLTYLMSFFVLLSFLVLAYAFMTDDFSLQYVSLHSNTHLPVWYKFSAIWGSHEGSLLLWVLILCGWSSAVAAKSYTLPDHIGPTVLSVLGIVGFGFLSFMLFTSSPFVRQLPDAPLQGSDLNPLLQDPGLIIHPPMLYMGYVGFSVAFAFAIAALITGNLNASWARWTRPWTSLAWAFLTLGITLGSWWAYYELGWGGWWFWDPVENASFMPWLAGTALIHSLVVTEKRGVFKSWTVLLAIFTFSLSLLGTFLVRSGVLTSVHAFAADPRRGVYILLLLVVLIGGSLLLYGVRAGQVRARTTFGATGREAWILLNNILLTVLTLTVLLGTLYPLLFEVLGLGRISVGPPYFNTVFVPMALLLVVFMAVGPLSKWHKTKVDVLLRVCLISVLCAVVLAVLISFISSLGWLGGVCLSVAFWALFLTFTDWFRKVSSGTKGIIPRARLLPRNYYGMMLAHLGIVVTLIGILLVSTQSAEVTMKLSPGESASFSGYTFQFKQIEHLRGPNYLADRAEVSVYKSGKWIATMTPEKRFYTASRQVMTEASLNAGFTRDLYVSLGEKLGDGSWSMRLYVKAFVRWIWFGGLMMMVGGLLSAFDKRYALWHKVVRSKASDA